MDRNTFIISLHPTLSLSLCLSLSLSLTGYRSDAHLHSQSMPISLFAFFIRTVAVSMIR